MISIVDDDPSIRRALRRLLRSAGYTVEVFESARAFLDRHPGDRVACLVLDIRMEGMNGFELQERLAAEQAAIPIIFMTAHDDARTRERAERAAPVAYLPKPFDGPALLEAIQRAVARP
jgi:FixJ family two-component response regulator